VTLQARYLLGAVSFVIAIIGLMTAAGSSDSTLYIGGLAVAAAAFGLCWLLLKGYYDRWERDPARPRAARPYAVSNPEKAAPQTPPPALPPQMVGYGLPMAEAGRASIDAQTLTWLRGAAIAVAGLVALAVAASGAGFAYWGGLLVFALAVLMLFRMIGRSFEREQQPSTGPRSAAALPAPPAGSPRWLAGAAAGLIGLIALFLASSGGALYYLGILVAVAAFAYSFYMIKLTFDEREMRGRQLSSSPASW